jgi:hypothetical protein
MDLGHLVVGIANWSAICLPISGCEPNTPLILEPLVLDLLLDAMSDELPSEVVYIF